MPGIFDNYENLSDNYIPSNSCYPSCPKPSNNCLNLEPCHPTKPYYTDYDIEGNIAGYWWYYGNTLNLEFTIEGEITIEGSSNWIPVEEDEVQNYLSDKLITIRLYNFRREIIYTKVLEATSNVITFPIDQELSNMLVRGIYYCSLNVSDKNLEFDQTILQLEDCVLNVK